MKLEKSVIDMSMFEKKNLTLEVLKEKLLKFNEIHNKFVFWDYKVKDNTLIDHGSNYRLCMLLGAVPSVLTALILSSNSTFLPILFATTIANVGITCWLRNLKHGLLKKRYKKWLMLNSDMNKIIEDNNNIFSLLLEIELNLKNLQKRILISEELNTTLTQSIQKKLEELKEIFASYKSLPESIEPLLEKINEIETFESEILKSIKTYELNSNYLDYKKANGIIENQEEKELIENKMVRDFKAIL